MNAVAFAAALLVAVALGLRATVLVPATGRHALQNHRGWEGRVGELHALVVKPGRHTQLIKTCQAEHPAAPGVFCSMVARHGGDRHELRLGGALLREWTAQAELALTDTET